MKRDLKSIASEKYNILIIGGGIYGAFAAWEAVTRGLSVALIEKNDFGCATSANSQKIIHGGFRYLQHADFRRMRESIRERTNLMRIAPHLVQPLPVLLPTYGYGIKGKHLLRMALSIYDVISFDRNHLVDREKHVPRGKILSKSDVLNVAPGLDDQKLTGGAVFYDAQIYNSERFILSVLKSADLKGVKIANHTEVIGILKGSSGVRGVEVMDHISKSKFEINADWIINTAGPWTRHVLSLASEKKEPPMRQVKCFNLITRKLFDHYAVGLYGKNQYLDQDAILNKGSRLFFVTPWRGHSVVGTHLSYYEDDPDKMRVNGADVCELIRDFNASYPQAMLQEGDVKLIQKGFLPSDETFRHETAQISKHYQIIDHSKDGLEHFISVIPVKYTTARDVSQKVIDAIFDKMNISSPTSCSATTPLFGGDIADWKSFLRDSLQKENHLPENIMESLIRNHGTQYTAVLKYLSADPSLGPPLNILRSEILHGVHEEMAQTLKDVVFRRTEIGTLGHPGRPTLEFCAKMMGEALDWNQSRISAEIQSVEDSYPFIS